MKCEPKAMLVGCNAGITAVDIDLDVSAASHCSDVAADAKLRAIFLCFLPRDAAMLARSWES